MVVIFNASRKIAGKIYPKSHMPVTLSDKLKDDWYLKGLIKVGDVSLAPTDVEAPASTASKGKSTKSAKAADDEDAE